ncbi:hypothetical protein K458DRAFT_384698 [Lentithecium fluviatile CBS 122367]|uniref:Uncharacterized protein n=1 Tax=Lentithecium fluviatile CBS 122367 TaxID=1168545 RepID=A0A6G1JDF8_9PLEO|nr:hypothetical protein K458DRAFT_384698 [Lentithecium fluviatile CBS 122367]
MLSDKYPACYFTFKHATQGNGKYFQYVYTPNEDGSMIWNASVQSTVLPNEPLTLGPTSETSGASPRTEASEPSGAHTQSQAPEASATVITVTISTPTGGFQTIVTSITITQGTEIGVRPPASPSLTTASPPPTQKPSNTAAIGVGVEVSMGFLICLAAILFILLLQAAPPLVGEPFWSIRTPPA